MLLIAYVPFPNYLNDVRYLKTDENFSVSKPMSWFQGESANTINNQNAHVDLFPR